LSGFASKWTIVASSLLAGEISAWLIVFGIVALFTSAVTLACYVKFFGMTFTSAGSEWSIRKQVHEVPATMLIPKLVLAAVCLVQGLIPFLMFGLITTAVANSGGFLLASEFSALAAGDALSFSLAGIRLQGIYGASLNAATSPLVVLSVLGIALLVAVVLKHSAGSKVVTAPTWLCGYQGLNNRTRYADRSMFSALKNFFWWTGGQGPAQHPAAKRGERS
jgi:hydrogenase-4 component B